MTDNNHPITIPPDLEEELLGLWPQEALQRAAQWGADQELQACCEWVSQWRCMVGGSRPEVNLRAARRPKPPSLAEEALAALEQNIVLLMPITGHEKVKRFAVIRRALERLQELEGQG